MSRRCHQGDTAGVTDPGSPKLAAPGSGQIGAPGSVTALLSPSAVTPAQRSCRVATDVDVRPLLGAARRSARSMRSTARRPMPWRLASSLERARPCALTPRAPRAPVATPSSCCHRRPQHRKLAALGKGSRLRQTRRRCCIGHRHGDLIPSLCPPFNRGVACPQVSSVRRDAVRHRRWHLGSAAPSSTAWQVLVRPSKLASRT